MKRKREIGERTLQISSSTLPNESDTLSIPPSFFSLPRFFLPIVAFVSLSQLSHFRCPPLKKRPKSSRLRVLFDNLMEEIFAPPPPKNIPQMCNQNDNGSISPKMSPRWTLIPGALFSSTLRAAFVSSKCAFFILVSDCQSPSRETVYIRAFLQRKDPEPTEKKAAAHWPSFQPCFFRRCRKKAEAFHLFGVTEETN